MVEPNNVSCFRLENKDRKILHKKRNGERKKFRIATGKKRWEIREVVQGWLDRASGDPDHRAREVGLLTIKRLNVDLSRKIDEYEVMNSSSGIIPCVLCHREQLPQDRPKTPQRAYGNYVCQRHHWQR